MGLSYISLIVVLSIRIIWQQYSSPGQCLSWGSNKELNLCINPFTVRIFLILSFHFREKGKLVKRKMTLRSNQMNNAGMVQVSNDRMVRYELHTRRLRSNLHKVFISATLWVSFVTFSIPFTLVSNI